MDAFFLPRGSHRLFCVLRSPPGTKPCRGAILHVPALAEEMNKSRRAVAQAARGLAESGWFVLTVDLTGTGDCGDDSGDNDFGDARWSDWVEDVRAAWHWLADRTGTAPLLWGLRAGCLLIDAALPGLPCPRVLYWQPSLSGDTVLTQFLRLRTAAGATRGDVAKGTPKESPKTLIAALERGETVEVAAYPLAPGLALPLRAARLGGAETLSAYTGKQVDWIEVSSTDPPALLPASEARIAALRQAGATVDARCVAGVGFWLTQEIDEAQGLVAATVAALEVHGQAEKHGSGGVLRFPDGGESSFQESGGVVGEILSDSRDGKQNEPELGSNAPAQPTRSIGDTSCNIAPGVREQPILFSCGGDELLGIASLPATPQSVGVVIVVGGPQTRVGSHRLFTLLARKLARRGIAAFRFDYRGMGDSSGPMRNFEAIEEDIGSATAAFRAAVPAVDRVVLWGLCDAASAILMGIERWHDVAGVVLANPWVRSEASENRTIVRHYYANRLRQPEFWIKLLRGGLPIGRVVREFFARLQSGFGRSATPAATVELHFRDRMRSGWQAFGGRRLVILSGQDLTAREFEDHVSTDSNWSLSRPDTIVTRMEDADHTFSRPRDHAAVFDVTCNFVVNLGSGD